LPQSWTATKLPVRHVPTGLPAPARNYRSLALIMPNELQLFSRQYDERFSTIPNLTWFPWVGINFPQRSPDQRLLVVGESHYAWVATPEQLEQHRKVYFGKRDYTREVIAECAIRHEWRNPTLDTIPKLLLGTSAVDLEKFWADTAFYNFIQTHLPYYNRAGSHERPPWKDFVLGWAVFVEVIRAIRPSQCVFIGVSAAYCFNDCMRLQKIDAEDLRRTVRIGRTWGRTAKLKLDGSTVELCFVQHLGKYFNWRSWRDYLQTQHPEMMNWLKAESYALI
jgi:hypothetical protein